MLQTENSVLIRRPVEDVYQFVAVDFFDNYPKWSPEVRELEKLSTGGMQIGTTGRQVRCDYGYSSEARFRVTHCDPSTELRFASLTSPYFEVSYLFAAVKQHTRLTFRFSLELPLLMRPMQGRIGAAVERGGERNVQNLKKLLETVSPAQDEKSGDALSQSNREPRQSVSS